MQFTGDDAVPEAPNRDGAVGIFAEDEQFVALALDATRSAIPAKRCQPMRLSATCARTRKDQRR